MKKKLELYLKNIKIVAKTGIILTIIFSCIYSSLHSGYNSYISFNKVKPNPVLINILSNIGSIKHYNLFLDYTGLNTGYGFFSPNVSSDFIITHNVYSRGKQKVMLSNSAFKSKEGSLRFAHINSLFMDKIEAIENDSIKVDSIRMEYLGMILRRMNNQQLQINGADSVRTTLFLYHYPFLKQYPLTNAKFLKIESYSKKR